MYSYDFLSALCNGVWSHETSEELGAHAAYVMKIYKKSNDKN